MGIQIQAVQCEQCYCNNKLKQLDYLGGRSYYISAATLEQELGNLWYVVATKPQPYSNSARITFIAVTVKLRQPTGQSLQSQDATKKELMGPILGRKLL